MKQYQKYDNRKLYDTSTGEYVSMLELSDVVASGESVRVTLYRNGRDVTLESLARALYERLLARDPSQARPFGPARLARLFPLVAARKGEE